LEIFLEDYKNQNNEGQLKMEVTKEEDTEGDTEINDLMTVILGTISLDGYD